MSDFVAIRKERKGGNKHIHPTIGLGLPLGEFCFYEVRPAMGEYIIRHAMLFVSSEQTAYL